MLQSKLIRLLVALSSGGLDSGALGLIKQSKLDSSDIGIDCHLSAKGIYLPDNLALSLTTDRRIAAHLGHGVDVAGEKQRGSPDARRRQRCLDAGMTGATDDYIILDLISIQRLNDG
jgi:hypothetical protein